jgi:hypothetical protein
VHGNPIRGFARRSEQMYLTGLLLLLQVVQGKGGILAAAPVNQGFWHEYSKYQIGLERIDLIVIV